MDRTTAKLERILDDPNRIWLHLLFWTFIYLDQILSVFGITTYQTAHPLNILSVFVLDAITVYFNLYILIGAYLLRGKLWKYVAFTVITLFINIEFKFLLRFNYFEIDISNLPDSAVISQVISDFAFTTFMLGTAIGAHFLRRNIMFQKKIRVLETEKLSTELQFLKDQINPHFLFNSLNNIYVQTRTRPKQASESILLLSDLLRYQLYDCAKDEVKLKNELQYLQNFLELERLRRSDADIQYELKGDPGELTVSPFLFIPFLENAVKHGANGGGGLYVDIYFEIVGDEKLYFRVKNSKRPTTERIDIKENKRSGGIGLNNVRRRLELIYPEKHTLVISNKPKNYTVELTINLN